MSHYMNLNGICEHFQSHSSQRKHELEKRRESEAEAARERRAQKRSRAEMEAEEREKGLGTELDATNKGFAMLQKMGYKKGGQNESYACLAGFRGL